MRLVIRFQFDWLLNWPLIVTIPAEGALKLYYNTTIQ